MTTYTTIYTKDAQLLARLIVAAIAAQGNCADTEATVPVVKDVIIDWIQHPNSRLGRRSYTRRVFWVLYDGLSGKKPRITPSVTQGKMISFVQDEGLGISDDTITKHVRAFRKLYNKGRIIPDFSLGQDDQVFFMDYDRILMKVLSRYVQLAAKNGTPSSGMLRRAHDLGPELAKLVTLPETTPEAIRCAENLRSAIEAYLPPTWHR
jgi:hypothetical protein